MFVMYSVSACMSLVGHAYSHVCDVFCICVYVIIVSHMWMRDIAHLCGTLGSEVIQVTHMIELCVTYE